MLLQTECRYVRKTCNLESRRPFNISIDIRQRKTFDSKVIVVRGICTIRSADLRFRLGLGIGISFPKFSFCFPLLTGSILVQANITT
jgi:hypothetical protein